MKVAQLLATIPDALPPEYATELIKLQSEAPPMGWAFVKRRMSAELGADWQKKFAELRAPAGRGRLARPGASRARRSTASELACKLQYPDMQSAVEADLSQLELLFAHPPAHGPGDRHHARSPRRSARGCARSSTTSARPSTSRSIATCSPASDAIRVPAVWPELSTRRLLTLDWLEGSKLLELQGRRRSTTRNRLAHRHVHGLVVSVQPLRRHPRRPASRQLHGVRRDDGEAGRHQSARLWLHPHLPAELRRRRGRSLSRPAHERRRRWWCTPTRPGASRALTAS